MHPPKQDDKKATELLESLGHRCWCGRKSFICHLPEKHRSRKRGQEGHPFPSLGSYPG